MEIVCCNCGTVSNKFRAVAYSPKYVEEYLEEYFDKPLADLLNRNIKPLKYRRIRKICIYVLYKFGGMTMTEVCEKYMVADVVLKNTSELLKQNNKDLLFIMKYLNEGLKTKNDRIRMN